MNSGGDQVNSINVVGLPEPGRIEANYARLASGRPTEPVIGVKTPQTKHNQSVTRNSLGSFSNNSENIPYKSSLKRSDSARRCTDTTDCSHAYHQTPSPTDSAVGDLGIALQEKDTEINHLRDTLENNEDLMFRVYQEKEKYWEQEMRRLKTFYEKQLKHHQQKSSKMEAILSNQTYQVYTHA